MGWTASSDSSAGALGARKALLPLCRAPLCRARHPRPPPAGHGSSTLLGELKARGGGGGKRP